MEKPLPPADGECCESACEPCVWDTYYAEMRLWQEEQKRLQEQEKTAPHKTAQSKFS